MPGAGAQHRQPSSCTKRPTPGGRDSWLLPLNDQELIGCKDRFSRLRASLIMPFNVVPDDSIPLRDCRICGIAKPATAEFFYVHGPRIRAECKDCFKHLKNARYASDPEWAREVARRSYDKVDGAAAKRRARDRKSTRLNSSHPRLSRMPSSA